MSGTCRICFSLCCTLSKTLSCHGCFASDDCVFHYYIVCCKSHCPQLYYLGQLATCGEPEDIGLFAFKSVALICFFHLPLSLSVTMAFPLFLNGSPAEINSASCFGCSSFQPCVVTPQSFRVERKGCQHYGRKHLCASCWSPFMGFLDPRELPGSCAAVTGNSGECTSTEADASVLDPPILPPYVCCKNKSCAADWKKAKHNASGYCSWTCAVQNGWEELSVNIPPPVESQPVAPVESQPVAPVEFQPVAPVESQPVAPMESQPANFYSIMDKGIGKRFLGAYAQKFKNLKPVEASCNEERKGIGFDDNTAKRRRFFHSAACQIEFVSGGNLD